MPAAPEISVIVTTHNVADWIGDCLSSLLDGQAVNIEAIVVDDRSTDGTWGIASARAATDSRIRLVRAAGHGGGQARNYGVELARAPYIAFCDGDDLVPPRAHEIMLRSARGSQPDMVVGNFLKFSATRTWCPTQRWSAFKESENNVKLADVPALIRNRACWNRLIRRDFWLERQIYFPSVPRSNDIVPMTKALLEARSISVVPDTVYLYRDRPGETSMTAMATQTINLLSYLSQEHICAQLVDSAGEPSLSRIYWDMFLNSDGWVHLRRFLATFSQTDGQTRFQEIAELLRFFIEKAPERRWRKLTHERQRLFTLCTGMEFAQASDLFRALRPGSAPNAVQGLSLDVDGHVARIVGECPAGIRPDACTLIIARPEDPESATKMGITQAAPGSDALWTFELEQAVLPADGGWQVSLQTDDGFGLLRFPVLITKSRISVSAKPWHHLSVTPLETDKPAHLSVFKRASILRRSIGRIVPKAIRKSLRTRPRQS